MTCLARLAPLLALSLALAQPAMADTLKKPAIDALAAMSKANPPAVFHAFLASAAAAEPSLAPAVAAHTAKAPLRGNNLVNIGQLLGLYNRLRNQAACIDTIGKMVALRTVRDEKVPQHENPVVIAFGTLVEALANDFGLSYRNVDNRVFEVTLPGAGKEVFGILTHADVVPAVADEWVLADGARLDPFKVTRVGDYLYGRGTIDDASWAIEAKSSPAGATLAMSCPVFAFSREAGGCAAEFQLDVQLDHLRVSRLLPLARNSLRFRGVTRDSPQTSARLRSSAVNV
jgi:hypothetical protein